MGADRQASPAQMYEADYGPAIFGPLSERVLPHASPDGVTHVLDVACGTGILTRRLASITRDGTEVVGVDSNPAMLEVARAVADHEGHRIQWRQGDGTALDLPDATFDLATCQQGLQFFPDRAAGAAELRRILRDGGRAVIAVLQGLDRHPLYAALADAEVPHLAAFGVPVSYEEAIRPLSLGDEDELRDLLLDAGFRDVEVVPDAVEARFPDADRFVERMEYAYAGVSVPVAPVRVPVEPAWAVTTMILPRGRHDSRRKPTSILSVTGPGDDEGSRDRPEHGAYLDGTVGLGRRSRRPIPGLLLGGFVAEHPAHPDDVARPGTGPAPHVVDPSVTLPVLDREAALLGEWRAAVGAEAGQVVEVVHAVDVPPVGPVPGRTGAATRPDSVRGTRR